MRNRVKWVWMISILMVPVAWFIFHEHEKKIHGKAAEKNEVIWNLGLDDNSSNEFSSYPKQQTSVVAVPSNWSKQSNWKAIPKGMKRDVNPNIRLEFKLASIPKYGAELSFKIIQADKAVPQMAVWSNNTMVGMLQIAGVGKTSLSKTYKESYQVYIPKEFLRTGLNVLQLSAVRCMWCSEAEDSSLWWEWDYLKLAALEEPAKEPLHGRYVQMGTMVTEGDFGYTVNAIRHLPTVLKWLGIAYSGNVMRTAFWSDVEPHQWQESGLTYMQTLKDYNMRIVADYQNTAFKLTANQTLPDDIKRNIDQFFRKYGSYINYYEVDNEPGLFNRSKAVNLAIADYVNSIKPKHVLTISPGWAYWPTGGQPDGWERDAHQRMEIEQKTQLTNGHSYGLSYADDEGGSFKETLKILNDEHEGLAKQMLVTEMGANDSHTDNPDYGSSQPHASVFDRIMRAHIGFADVFLQHAAFFPEYGLFQDNFNWSTHDPVDTAAYPGINQENSRLKTYRRLALAYATHGAPLSYDYLNASSIANKKVYFRAVNTATLPLLPAKGATNKTLLNFVNFETSTQTMYVRVTMPEKGTYEGERIGAGKTFGLAKTNVQEVWAGPDLDLRVELGPGEAVQYILNKKIEK
ncbi:hypothetical protein QFZ77_001854 [Paenibacillus sp. V4I3]|uniref:polysaccharide lyase family protein n=1 Tax=Paenibacillus sp. V4I3 TaxID=3042305 RepID=UPI00277F8BF0|nr:polysaccharide lyase family protein [Paenibacillus sp. V4I3]MDQ0873195.1 hypothetical protein [Paenibacillus sp. V4I3]